MFGKFEVVHLVGRTKGNDKLFQHIEEELTKKRYIVFKPVFYVDKEHITNIDMLNDMCYEKLLVADIVCAVGKEHIGKSTINRLSQALEHNKKVMIWDGKDMVPYEDWL